MEDVFMEQPQEFIDGSKLDFVCKFYKSICGS